MCVCIHICNIRRVARSAKNRRPFESPCRGLSCLAAHAHANKYDNEIWICRKIDTRPSFVPTSRIFLFFDHVDYWTTDIVVVRFYLRGGQEENLYIQMLIRNSFERSKRIKIPDVTVQNVGVYNY